MCSDFYNFLSLQFRALCCTALRCVDQLFRSCFLLPFCVFAQSTAVSGVEQITQRIDRSSCAWWGATAVTIPHIIIAVVCALLVGHLFAMHSFAPRSSDRASFESIARENHRGIVIVVFILLLCKCKISLNLTPLKRLKLNELWRGNDVEPRI